MTAVVLMRIIKRAVNNRIRWAFKYSTQNELGRSLHIIIRIMYYQPLAPRKKDRCNILTCAFGVLALGFGFVAYTIHKTEAQWGGKKLWNDFKAQPFTAATHTQMTAMSVCLNEKEVVVAQTSFAFVTVLTNNFDKYGAAAAKLGLSLKQHTAMDRIMFELQGSPIPENVRRKQIEVGWKICIVSGKAGKVHAWALTEYEGVVLLDADILALRTPVDLFVQHLTQMKSVSMKVGAVRNHPSSLGSNNDDGGCSWLPVRSPFNMGVLLVEPHEATWERLQESVYDDEALHRFFQSQIYELPLVYNAMTDMRACEPTAWYANRHEFRLMHYTMSKPWTYSVHKYWRAPVELLSCWFWGVEDYCVLWDLIQ